MQGRAVLISSRSGNDAIDPMLSDGLRMMRFFKAKPRAAPSLPGGYRVYAIGDVHGCLSAFDELLAMIKVDNLERGPARSLLILLGDLIDRGPDSAGVVARAMEGFDWIELHTLKGNHEAALLDALNGDERMLEMWLHNGGDVALKSWGLDLSDYDDQDTALLMSALRDAIPEKQQNWMRKCKLALHIGDYFFVHAGVRPGTSLLEQADVDCLWIRQEFLESKRDLGAVVVHGHSVSTAVEDMENRIGIDTGAYATGRLSAVGLEGAERWFLQTSSLASAEDAVRLSA